MPPLLVSSTTSRSGTPEHNVQLARVIGDVVATVKDANLTGIKLLILQPISTAGESVGRTLVALDSIIGYMPSVPHWGYNGSARRYWDFIYAGAPGARYERQLHHYGSGLNAIPALARYREQPDDFHLLRIGYAGTMGDVLRLALPPRRATPEKKPTPTPEALPGPPGLLRALKDDLTFPLAWGTSPVRDFARWRRAARRRIRAGSPHLNGVSNCVLDRLSYRRPCIPN